jgi:hypothetical protein
MKTPVRFVGPNDGIRTLLAIQPIGIVAFHWAQWDGARLMVGAHPHRLPARRVGARGGPRRKAKEKSPPVHDRNGTPDAAERATDFKLVQSPPRVRTWKRARFYRIILRSIASGKESRHGVDDFQSFVRFKKGSPRRHQDPRLSHQSPAGIVDHFAIGVPRFSKDSQRTI